jgi:hypothetical protein
LLPLQELDTVSASARGTSGSLSPIVLILIELQNQHVSEEDPQPDLPKTQPCYLCLKLILVHYAPNQLNVRYMYSCTLHLYFPCIN